jgi:hypothetical protein
MTQREESDRARATNILAQIAQRYELTPGVALELAAHLCHLAGGDGRGVFRIEHDPSGDRL